MNNWKIISRIASISGIVFAVFAALSGFTTYELIVVQYSSAPAAFIQFSVLASMLVYLLLAVILFVVSGVASRGTKEKVEELMQPEQGETQETAGMKNEENQQ